MLSKEEIETCKEEAKNYIQFMKAKDNEGWLRGLLWYIDQLEADKQKLIEKLEKVKQDIKQDQYTEMYYLKDIEEILSILKGE